MKKFKGNVSVDFDGTLDRADVEEYMAELIGLGYNVHILTSREPQDETEAQLIDNSDLFDVANQLGIPAENIFFTAFVPKYHYLEMSNMIFHLDDSEVELGEIDKLTNTVAINANTVDFRDKCDKVLGLK
jgi:hypothetical protein